MTNRPITINEGQRAKIEALLKQRSEAATAHLREWAHALNVDDSILPKDETVNPSKYQTLMFALGDAGLSGREVGYSNRLHHALAKQGLLKRNENDPPFVSKPTDEQFSVDTIEFDKLKTYSDQVGLAKQLISDLVETSKQSEDTQSQVLAMFALQPSTLNTLKDCLTLLAKNADESSQHDLEQATSKEGEDHNAMHVIAKASEILTTQLKEDLKAGVIQNATFRSPLLDKDEYQNKLRSFAIKLSAREPLEGQALDHTIDRYTSSVVSHAARHAFNRLGGELKSQMNERQKLFYERSQKSFIQAEAYTEAAHTLEEMATIIGVERQGPKPSQNKDR